MNRRFGHLDTHGKSIQIESEQRRFTKRLRGLNNVKFKERLEQLKLETLEMRRLRHALIFTHKVIFGLVSGACNVCVIPTRIPKIPIEVTHLNNINVTVVLTLVNTSLLS
jgi:hypothetical protein